MQSATLPQRAAESKSHRAYGLVQPWQGGRNQSLAGPDRLVDAMPWTAGAELHWAEFRTRESVIDVFCHGEWIAIETTDERDRGSYRGRGTCRRRGAVGRATDTPRM